MTQPTISKTTILLIVAGMLTAGVCNTIFNKLQDMQCVANCDSPDPTQRKHFEQPLWQTLNMFIGETLCVFVLLAGHLRDKFAERQIQLSPNTPHLEDRLIPNNVEPSALDQLDASAIVDDTLPFIQHDNKLEELHGWKAVLFWIPTLCDMTATTTLQLMNVGLIYTTASVYQMLRGAVVIFTGLFSWIFLGRRITKQDWLSLVLVVGGVAIVGMSSIIFPTQTTKSSLDEDPDSPILPPPELDWTSVIGVLLVLGAQLFTASQFVIEEKLMVRFGVRPIKAVALEGIFGLLSVLIGMPILHFTLGQKYPGGYFDVPAGFHQIVDHPVIWLTVLGSCFSIAFFNFFGLSVTTQLKATARSIIDTCRTLFIWMVSIALGWEHFSSIQVIGFTILVLGTLIFNGVIGPKAKPQDQGDEHEPLMNGDEESH
ncbi:hypothetical protein BZG36_02747 [Bifiguratus adelaidae]|uniref:EamA domain-containing protein n=1 Tax=Bifiguratus adelaidae TaxID=1938954 RepID=A0A261XYR6_9FUNG|nr:hypothetical protein BZG36_02747 [Bifiguratus adelaidae]